MKESLQKPTRLNRFRRSLHNWLDMKKYLPNIIYLTPPENKTPEAKRLQKMYEDCVTGKLEKPEGKIIPWSEGLLGVDDPNWIEPGSALEMDQQQLLEGKRIVYLEKIEEPDYPGKLFRAYIEEESVSPIP
jgi:hypothetical protein